MNIVELHPVDEKWTIHQKSSVIKWLMRKSKVISDVLIAALGTTDFYFDHDLSHNYHSVDDLVTIAYFCGYSVCFMPNDNNDMVYKINGKEYVEAKKPDAFERVEKKKENNMAELVKERINLELKLKKLNEAIDKLGGDQND